MFAMMRALGFRLPHILSFVTLQAFTFSIPGMCIGILIAFVLNVGAKMWIYLLFGNFGSYQLSTNAIVSGTVCFGVVVPLISNVGPTRVALGKNLRQSLDANRRSTIGEEVSVTFKRLKDISFSLNETLLAFTLTLLGFLVYVFIPASLIRGEMAVFFLIMNLILVAIALGMTFIATVILPPM